jgi:Ca2+-binding RTX toxin-like protein
MTTYIGTSGNDVSLAAFNTMYGLDGNDFIETSTSSGSVDGGAGNDIVSTNSTFDVSLYGGDGNDVIINNAGTSSYMYGGYGSDLMVASNFGFGSNPNGGEMTLSGNTISVDTMYGGDGADAMYGSFGDDILYGGEGSDQSTVLITAGDSNEINAFSVKAGLFGGDGSDFIDGGRGNDYLDGGVGNDQLFGGTGNDVLIGGAGDDLIITSQFIAVGLPGSGGTSTYAYGGADNDTVYGYGKSDTVYGQGGNDLLYNATDNASFYYGDAGNDVLSGGAGVDYLDGGTENDYIQAGAGADNIYGGTGVDQLFGGFGIDNLTGGAGTDYFLFNSDIHAADYDVITDFTAGTDFIGLPTYMTGKVGFSDTAFGMDVFFAIGTSYYQILLQGIHSVATAQNAIYFDGV